MSIQASNDYIDVAAFVDARPTRGQLVRIVLLCAAVALLDGANTTSIGLAAPVIATGLNLSQAHLGPIFSSATFGAMLGALSFGLLADHFGRKRMLIIAILLFGVFTLATGLSETYASLLAVRFLAGVGLGGAAPCFIALGCEHAPSARRALVTTLIWTTFPLGVILGAMLNSYILANAAWPVIFFSGGTLSFVACAAIVAWLPESAQFVLLKKRASDQSRRVASRIRPALDISMRSLATKDPTSRTPMRELFSKERVAETLLTWIAFAAAFGMTASTFFWSPVLLHNHGHSLAAASLIVGVGAGLGSLVGAAMAGFVIQLFGAITTLAWTFLLATVSVAALGFSASSPVALILNVVANGILIAGISTSGMLAFVATIYPVAMRSTGVGWAMGFGRFGEVLLPLLVALIITITGELDQTVFLVLAAMPLLGAVSIMTLGLRRRLRKMEVLAES